MKRKVIAINDFSGEQMRITTVKFWRVVNQIKRLVFTAYQFGKNGVEVKEND